MDLNVNAVFLCSQAAALLMREKGGGVILARRTGANTILVGMHFAKAWRLGSWDRFYLPVPFSRIELRAEEWSTAQLADCDDPLPAVRSKPGG